MKASTKRTIEDINYNIKFIGKLSLLTFVVISMRIFVSFINTFVDFINTISRIKEKWQ